MKKNLSLGLAISALIALAGCGGSGGSSVSALEGLETTNTSSDVIQPLQSYNLCVDEQIALTQTEIDALSELQQSMYNEASYKYTSRYDTNNTQIPIYFIGSDTRFGDIVKKIEEMVGADIFADPIQISGPEYFDTEKVDCDPNSNPDYSSKVHVGKGGIVFSQGTAYLPAGGDPQNYCGNVSNAPYDGGYRQYVDQNGHFSTGNLVYLNLDNPQCTSSNEIAVHELAHALGMTKHFDGFGIGDAWSGTASSVLKTLYKNPPKTYIDDIVVY